jgi:SAM-dependent methyltransferase
MAEWFTQWFNEEYLALYAHRDDSDARRLFTLVQRAVPWEPGWRVLDVACGPGRHTRLFAEAGARVTGLDLSMVLLRHAREVTTAPLVRADMRALPIAPGAIDLAVNLFTSFGYFDDDATHAQVIAGIVATLRPGGWFVLDFLNAPKVREDVQAEEAAAGTGPRAAGWETRRRVSDDGRFVRKTIVGANGRSWEERVRLLDVEELATMCSAAGLQVTNRFGDYDGGPWSVAGPRAILIGTRA